MQPKPILLFAMVVLGFGSAFSLTNIAVTSLPPIWVAAGRSLVALVGMGIFLVVRAQPTGFEKTDLKVYALVGMLTGVAPYVLISWGQQFISSSLAGILFASTPLLTLVFGVAMFQVPRPCFATVAGTVVGFGGLGLTLSTSLGSSSEVIAGTAVTLGAAASYALGGLMVQRHPISNMVGFSAMQLVPATVILLATALAVSGVPSSSVTGQTGLVHARPLLAQHYLACAADFSLRRSIFHQSGRSNRSTGPDLNLTFGRALHELKRCGQKRATTPTAL